MKLSLSVLGRRPAPWKHHVGRSTAACRGPHRFRCVLSLVSFPSGLQFLSLLTVVGGVAPAAHYNPPTTACGAPSVFETPSVLRESLPSCSAKPGAFYAPRALRWTTPPRGRTDPFQGPKIKPMFHRFSMLFQDDLGVENGGQNEVKIY